MASAAAHLLTRDEARRIAANIAKLAIVSKKYERGLAGNPLVAGPLAVVDPSSVRGLGRKERAIIAARTKAALAATRWDDLGGPTLAKARKLAITLIKALAHHQAANVLPVIRGYGRLAA
jgi:hypothetical protein